MVEGATAEIRLGSAKKGNLWLSVERTRTAKGVTVEARYLRSVNCHPDRIAVCHTQYDVRRRLPETAFTLDATLDAASLTATVEGKQLRLTWTGFGTTERSAGQYGALTAESRPAAAVGSWGTVKHKDQRNDSTTSLLFRRVNGPG